MRIGFVTRAKQGDIFEALERRGWSQKKGAEFIGMHQSDFGNLLNMKWVPEEFSPTLTLKLYELTGKSPEELFPEWARKKDFLNIPKVRKRTLEITPKTLQSAGALYLPPGPEEVFSKEEAARVINEALESLSPREREVVERHVMRNETLDSIGRDLGLTGARVGQISKGALKKLRHPTHTRTLRNHLEY